MNTEPLQVLLQNDATVFPYDFGKKEVKESWTVRRNNAIKSVSEIKTYTNYHLITGDANIVDVDLDCTEARLLADYFLPQTAMEYGRKSTPRSHRLYKVLDLDKKKHTRKYFSFDDPDVDKKTLVELRANDHYSMCFGRYNNDEDLVWTSYKSFTETSWDALYKSVAMLSAASIILRNYPKSDRNVYIWKISGALWHHKVEIADAERIIEVVCKAANDEETKSRLAKLKHVYKDEPAEQIQGLPKLAEHYEWSKAQTKNFKDCLYAITGRSALPEATHDFVQKIVYMMKQKKFYDLDDKEMYDQEAIDMKYARDFHKSKYTPLKHWKLHPDRKVCVDFTYKPDDPKRIISMNKKLMINVYEKPDIQPDPKADTDVFWNLVERVIPHDECREHFLDWITYQIQNPGKKIRHAIIMQSNEFQVGKGSLFDLLRMIVGKHNSRKIELAEALDKGKGFLINAQTVLIDEAKSSGSWSEKAMLINTLKTMITEGTVGVRQLYREYSEQETCTNYWINTNYKDAFNLPPREVRYWVYFSPATQDLNLLNAFHEARLKDNLAAGVLAELLDRDISKFKPLAPAPWTQYRDEMSKLADKPLHEYVKDQFEQCRHPFDRPLLTVPELFEYLREKKKMKVTRERDVADALDKIGGKKKRGCTVKDVGQNVTIWIIRDHNEYQNLSAPDLGRKYQPFYSERSSVYG